jgi:7-cyano-7-deazaguanine synthase|tara:strand:- start:195 stop:1025 length:831 start_codon:yes stop_codon:yes gene_type:complete
MQLEIDYKQTKHCVISLSGGMDSSTLLLRAIKEYDSVTALSFNYGQKHVVELERAQSLINYLNTKGYDVKYRQIKLDGLVDLLNSALVEGGDEVPEGHYEQDNMKATVVPNRNKIFSSITQAVALSVATETGEQTDIALGIHAGDHAIYPDCRQEWRDADDHAFRMGNWDVENVGYFTPYLDGDKFDILKDGEVLCKDLNIDFDDVYVRTNTSYKPIFDEDTFEWYSDYKSASSVERVEAFLKLGRPDPAPYADETGPVTWEHVVTEVSKVLAEHE